MKLPVIPILVAATLLGGVVYLFNATWSERKTLDVPKVMRLADIDGIETEVAIAADGNRCAVIASGDLWMLNLATGDRKRLTQTPQPESFPAWSTDNQRVTFTRGSDTFAVNPDTGAEELFRAGATWLSWSATSRTTFVRERALWVANPNDQNEQKLVEADARPDVTIQTPRFSPDALQIAFIKSQMGIRGEVWLLDVPNGMSRELVVDRAAENPMDVGWIVDGRNLAYLTDRAGAYSIWQVDLVESTILPLTQPLFTVPLGRIGMSVLGDRLVLPRHFVDSNIVLSPPTGQTGQTGLTGSGTTVANTEKLEFEPAISPDERLIAYTIAEENSFEIWTSGINGEKPTFRTLGRDPRFGPNNYEVIYTHTDLNGNADIWKIDIRNGSAEHVTDADEIDVSADWSHDGRSIVFTSGRGDSLSVWTIPASGGKRLRINDGGYGARYSPDSRSILFWNREAFWITNADGRNAREIQSGIPTAAAGAWTPKGPAFVINGEIRTATEKLFGLENRALFPQFDVLRDGRFVVAPIDIRETGLWSIDLTYREN
jgi:Tol biopolymer transport system component